MLDWVPLIGDLPLIAEAAALVIVIAVGTIVIERLSEVSITSALAEGLFVVPIALFVGAVAVLSVVAMIGIPVLIGAIALHLTGGHLLVWVVFSVITLLAAWVAIIDLQSI